MAEITTRYSKLSDPDFYKLFTVAQWRQLDFDARLAAAQEVEIRAAARQGRPAIPVRAAAAADKGSKNGSILFGSFHPDQIDITLNYGYLDWNIEMNNIGLSPASLLNTILHEGRHCLQYMCIRQMIPLPAEIDEDTLLQWFASEYGYLSAKNAGFPYYKSQANERDARRFAALEFKRIYRNIVRATGERLPEFEQKIRNAHDIEKALVSDVAQLTPEELEKLAAMANAHFSHFYNRLAHVRRFMELRGLKLADMDILSQASLNELRDHPQAFLDSLNALLLQPDDLLDFTDLDVEEAALREKHDRMKVKLDRHIADASRTASPESTLVFRG